LARGASRAAEPLGGVPRSARQFSFLGIFDKVGSSGIV